MTPEQIELLRQRALANAQGSPTEAQQAPQQTPQGNPTGVSPQAAYGTAEPPQEAQVAGETEEEEDAASSIFDTVTRFLAEIPEAVTTGATDAVNELSDTTAEAGTWLNRNVADLGRLNLDFDPETPLWESQTDADRRRLAKMLTETANGNVDAKDLDDPDQFDAALRSMGIDPAAGVPFGNELRLPKGLGAFDGSLDTGGAKVVQGMTQFLVGYATAGRFIKGDNAIASGMAKGAVADAVFFDPWESRLSNLIEENTDAGNAITAYLASSDEDSAAEGRLKNAIEGLGLGIIAEGLVRGVKAMRHARKGDTEAALKVIDEEVEPFLKEQGIDVDAAVREADSLPPAKKRPSIFDTIKDVADETEGAPPKPPRGGQKASKGATQDTLIRFDEDSVAELQERLKAGHTDPMPMVELARGVDINFNRIDDDNGIRSVFQSIRDTYAPQIDKARGGIPRSFETVQRDAQIMLEEMGKDPDEALRWIQRQSIEAGGDITKLDSAITAARIMNVSTAKELSAAAHAITQGVPYKGLSGPDLDEYLERLSLTATELHASVAQRTTALARALSAHRIGAHAQGVDPEVLNLIRSRRAGSTKDLARAIVKQGSDPKAIMRANQESTWRKLLLTHNEAWKHAILSGPQTWTINTLAGVVQNFWMPVERILAGALARDKGMMREGAYQLMLIKGALRDSLDPALQVLKDPDYRNILDPENTKYDDTIPNSYLTSAAWGKDSRLFDLLGQVIRTPGRMMAASDELVKGISFRSRTRAMAMAEGRAKGLSFGEAIKYGYDKASRAVYNADSPSVKAGTARVGQINPHTPLGRAGLEESRQATFTQDLGAGTFGHSLQSLKSKHPTLDLILPFVRTPTNILRWTWQRTPGINFTSSQFRSEWSSSDPAIRAAARAKLAVGTGAVVSAYLAASEGLVTGSGPENPHTKAMWIEGGWRPYALKVGDRYVELSRLDPQWMLFGIVADIVEVSGDVGERDTSDLINAAITATIKNVVNKAYLTGLKNVVSALSEPDRYLETWAEQQASSYVPNFVASVNQDPLLREVHGVVEAMKRKIPGMSETLDPRRNLLGEVQRKPGSWGWDMVSPFAQGFDKDDPVVKALGDIEEGFSPPPEKRGNIDLLAPEFRTSDTQTAYDRWQELLHKPPRGRSLREDLERLVTSERFKRLSGSVRTPDGDYVGQKRRMVARIIGSHRDRAWNALLRENKPLRDAYRREQRLKKMVRRYGADAITRLEEAVTK